MNLDKIKKLRSRYLTKKVAYTFAFSTILLVICFAILIFKVFYPYHRVLSIGLYILSYAVYICPIVRKLNMKYIKELANGTKVRFFRRNYISIISIAVFLFILYLLYVMFPVDNFSLANMDINELEEKIETDALYVQMMIGSMEETLNELEGSGLLELTIEQSNPEKTAMLKAYFARIADHIIILERFMDEYKYFYQINYLKYPQVNQKAFLISFTPYIAKYKLIFELTKNIDKNQYVESVLNEELPELKQKDVYHKLKMRFDSPKTIVRINAGRIYLKYIESTSEDKDELLAYAIDSYSLMFGEFDHTLKLSVDNALDTFEKETNEKWLPMQKGVANMLGETKVTARHEYFITDSQIDKVVEMLEPGDIMFQRRNWYVSNAGMPGFWTHSAIYIGTLDVLDSYFADEAEEMLNSSVSDYLMLNFPELYNDKSAPDEDGHLLTTIEGKSAGIIMLPMEISAKADYLAAVRPQIPKKDKLKTILYLFENYKKPYDYNFDFTTDDSLVCSELVYKAYLPDSGKKGLNYTLTTVAGRYMLAPNDMVRAFSENYMTSGEQNIFVFFLDGNEEHQRAEFSGLAEFMESWERPKYGIFLD
ncbi:hypothetical protein JXB31_02830 [Candidatus Woesearchaeota archaeon]|nr:hypothetical protein [Candidatus Woesearchaeota archaeon]